MLVHKTRNYFLKFQYSFELQAVRKLKPNETETLWSWFLHPFPRRLKRHKRPPVPTTVPIDNTAERWCLRRCCNRVNINRIHTGVRLLQILARPLGLLDLKLRYNQFKGFVNILLLFQHKTYFSPEGTWTVTASQSRRVGYRHGSWASQNQTKLSPMFTLNKLWS